MMMTQPVLDENGLPPLLDAGNSLLARVPCHMVTGKLPTPDGECGVLTIRTADVTLTLILDKASVSQWTDAMAGLRDALSSANLVIPVRGQAMQIADAARNGQQP